MQTPTLLSFAQLQNFYAWYDLTQLSLTLDNMLNAA
jgi:hypothetical protein